MPTSPTIPSGYDVCPPPHQAHPHTHGHTHTHSQRPAAQSRRPSPHPSPRGTHHVVLPPSRTSSSSSSSDSEGSTSATSSTSTCTMTHTASALTSSASATMSTTTTSTSAFHPRFPPSSSTHSHSHSHTHPHSPYPLSLGSLRQRRRSSTPLTSFARRRLVTLVLTLSIPVLALMLMREVAIRKTRAADELRDPSAAVWSRLGGLDVREVRRVYEKRRRKELQDVLKEQRRLLPRSERSVEDEGWSLQTEVDLAKEVQDHWPDWWGSSDLVGRSPWDHVPVPVPEDQRKRVLFLTDYNDYLERMNTHTYEIVDAAMRHPNTIVDVWGPGWAGWDRALPLSVNVRRRAHRIAQLEASKRDWEEDQRRAELGRGKQAKREWWSTFAETTRAPNAPPRMEEAEQTVWEKPEWSTEDVQECSSTTFDLVWTISDIFKQNDPLVDALECGSLLVQQLGDCHEMRCLKEWYPLANNITVSKYAFELQEIFDFDRVRERFPTWTMGLFGHSPDTGNEWDFYPVPWANKTADAKMFGFDGSFYPIRTAISDYFHRHEEDPSLPEPIIHRHEHPGYVIWPSDQARHQPLETYEPNHEYYQNHLRTREDFAKGMRESRICVFDASLERKMIRKYAQAFLSGCVVAADLPTEHEEALSKFTIVLKPTWSIERIHEELQKYLDRPEKLHQMAMDAYAYARGHLTTTKKVSDMLEMVDAHRQGSRGYWLPYGFSLRCRAYWSGGDGAWRPPWCSSNGPYRGSEG